MDSYSIKLTLERLGVKEKKKNKNKTMSESTYIQRRRAQT